MANSKNLKKGLHTKTKNNVLIGIIVAVVVLTIVGYVIYVSGFLPSVMTGVKITKVNESGKTVVVDNVSVAELNIHYFQVINEYNSTGAFETNHDLDAIDETTGKTMREQMTDKAADNIKNLYFLTEWGKANIPNFSDLEKVASHYMEISIDNLRDSAEKYNYPNLTTYLHAMYGTGCSLRVYRDTVQKEVLGELIQNYVQQYNFSADRTVLQQDFDANPLNYTRCDFNYYSFASDSAVNEDGEIEFDNTKALENANYVASKATDSASFVLAVMDKIEDEEELAKFETETEDPTLMEGATNISTSAMAGGEANDFLFEDGEVGTTKVIDMNSSVWVIFLKDRYMNDMPVVTYRTLVLYNDKKVANGDSEEAVAKSCDKLVEKANSIVASISDEQSFATQVGLNSSNSNDIMNGGKSVGMTEKDFEPTNGSQLPTGTQQLKDWAFDASRAHGDMTVIRNEGNTTVTIYYWIESIPAWMYESEQQIVATQYSDFSTDPAVFPETGSVQIAYDLIKKLTY